MLNALPSCFAPQTPVTGHTSKVAGPAHGEDAVAARGGFADVLSQAKAPHETSPVNRPEQAAQRTEAASKPEPEPEAPRHESTPTNALPPKPATRGAAAQAAKPRASAAGGKADKAHPASTSGDSPCDEPCSATRQRSASMSDDSADALPIDPMVMQAAARAAAQDAKTAISTTAQTPGDVDATAVRDDASASAEANAAPALAAAQAIPTLETTQPTPTDTAAAAAAVPLAPTALVAALPAQAAAVQARGEGRDSLVPLGGPRAADSRLPGDAGTSAAGARGNVAPAPTPGAAATSATIGTASPKELEIAAAAGTAPQAAEGASANAQPNPAAALSCATGLADALAPKAGAHATTEVRVPAAVNSPEFAPALGMTLSTLAANGVQEARLQLHPAELGPISVQIAVDGTGARIDFQADVAQTRQAIQDSLPSLAGALRDAGLTLTGGGVSQHSQQPGQPGQSGARGSTRGSSGPANGDVTAIGSTASRSVQRRGLVDLLA